MEPTEQLTFALNLCDTKDCTLIVDVKIEDIDAIATLSNCIKCVKVVYNLIIIEYVLRGTDYYTCGNNIDKAIDYKPTQVQFMYIQESNTTNTWRTKLSTAKDRLTANSIPYIESTDNESTDNESSDTDNESSDTDNESSDSGSDVSNYVYLDRVQPPQYDDDNVRIDNYLVTLNGPNCHHIINNSQYVDNGDRIVYTSTRNSQSSNRQSTNNTTAYKRLIHTHNVSIFYNIFTSRWMKYFRLGYEKQCAHLGGQYKIKNNERSFDTLWDPCHNTNIVVTYCDLLHGCEEHKKDVSKLYSKINVNGKLVEQNNTKMTRFYC
jgi:hypothetical protein